MEQKSNPTPEELIAILRHCEGEHSCNCYDCPAKESSTCRDRMRLAADMIERLNDFEKTESARLLIMLGEKQEEISLLQKALSKQIEELDCARARKQAPDTG